MAKKKGPKKISKKEKQKIAEAEAKRKAAEEEAERVLFQKEEKERIKREAKEAKERAIQEASDHAMRVQNLKYSCELLSDYQQLKVDYDINVRNEEEWILYRKCNGLPSSYVLAQMNAYLFHWQQDRNTDFIEHSLPKTEEVLNLLKDVNNLIDNPLDYSEKDINNIKEVRDSIREELQHRLDMSAFYLLRQLEMNLTQTDLETVTYVKESPYLTLCFWTSFKIPRALNDSRPPPFIEFPKIGVTIKLPPKLTHVFLVVRGLWLKYDHFSDLCRTWEPKPLPEQHRKTLIEIYNEECAETERIRLDQLAEEAARIENTKKKKNRPITPPPQIVVTDSGNTIELVPTGHEKMWEEELMRASTVKMNEAQPEHDAPPQRPKTPRDIMKDRQKEKINDLRKYLEVQLEPGELNMRKYVVLGGVYHLDLLEQPPQPKVLVDRSLMTVLEGEHKLQHLDYYEEYKVNLPDKDGNGDVTDAETKAAVEKEQIKLVAISIVLPQSVLWFKPPTAVQWNKHKKIWSNANIHDAKFNGEKQVLSFKTGLMAPIGLSTFRFANLPYQTWELRPDWKGPPGGIFFSITAATVIVEFIIRGNQVCLNQLQNATSTAMQDIVGTFYAPHQLIRLMRQGGVDVFPQHDAYLYVEGVTQKHYTAENHLYHCMALFSNTFNFSWSRWNLLAGRDNMVMQIREFLDRKRLANYQMLLVTPLKAAIVDCTEVSQSFNQQGVEGMSFYPDLFMLVSDRASSLAAEKIMAVDLRLVETVYHILFSTRVLSYS